MSSNYPPGVTGNEPQIAGRPVRAEERTCDSDSAMFVPKDEVMFWFDQLLRAPGEMRLILAADWTANGYPWVDRTGPKISDADRLRAIGEQVERHWKVFGRFEEEVRAHEVERPCEFEGEVEVEVEHGLLCWTCPRCGKEHEEEPDGPDPDDQRDVERGL